MGEANTTSCKAVFVDTNLDTHLALIVDTSSDTVSVLKKKILQEHLVCFPALGEVQIHALKVKRGGHFYHLSESMLVQDVFFGVNKNWFVSVDASTLKGRDDEEGVFGPGCNNSRQLALVDVTGGGGGLAGGVSVLPDAHREGSSNEEDPIAVVFPCSKRDQSVKERASCSDTQPQVESLDAIAEIGNRDGDNDVQRRVVEDNVMDDVEKALDVAQPAGASEAVTTEKRKWTSKKRKKMAEETDPVVPQGGKNKADLDNTVLESLAGTTNVADGPTTNASSDGNRRLNSKQPRTEVAGAMGEVVQSRNDEHKSISPSELGDATKILSHAKKKRKVEKLSGNEDSTKENISLEGVGSAIPSDKKKSRKKSLNHVNQESVSMPSPEVDISSAGIMKDIIANDTGVGPVTSPSSKDHLLKSAAEYHHLTSKVSSDKQEGTVSEHENLMLNDHQIIETDRTQRTEEGVALMKINEGGGASVAGDGGKSSKKRKKTKATTKDSFSESPMTSGREHAKGHGNDTFSNEPIEAINDQVAVYIGNKEVDSPHKDMKNAMLSESRVADGETHDNGTNKEFGDRQEDSMFSEHEHLIPNHHQSLAANGTQRVEEGGPLLCNKEVYGTSHMTGTTVDGGRSSKKKKKTKGIRDSVSETPKTSDAEHANVRGNHEDRKNAISSTAGVDDRQIGDNVATKESSGRQDSGIPPSEKLTLDDHQIVETDRTKRVEEGVALLGDEVDRTSHKTSVAVDVEKSSKKRKKTRGARDSNAPRAFGAELAKGPGNVAPSNEPNGAINDNLTIDVGKKEVDLPHKGGKTSASPTVASSVVAAREHDNNIQNKIDSVRQIENSRASVGSIDGKSRKKSTKKSSSKEKKLPASQAENESAYFEDPEQMNEMVRDIAESSLKMMEQTGADHTSSETQLNGSNTGYRNHAGVNDNLLGAQLNSVAVAPSQVQGIKRVKHLEPVDIYKRGKARKEDGCSTDMEASSHTGEINFKDYFRPIQSQDNVASGEVQVLVDAKSKTTFTNGKLKTIEDKKKLLFNSHDAHRNKVLQTGKVSKQTTMKEDKILGGRKVSAFNTGEVVDSKSEEEKRLIGSSGAIFKDDANGIDANGKEFGSSDASTEISSDTSESSDFSDEETNSDLNSPERGFYSTKRTDDSGRKLAKSIPAGMSLDEILRSSSRYKKAKLNASQSQLDDTESQPIDFVPDTQPDL